MLAQRTANPPSEDVISSVLSVPNLTKSKFTYSRLASLRKLKGPRAFKTLKLAEIKEGVQKVRMGGSSRDTKREAKRA